METENSGVHQDLRSKLEQVYFARKRRNARYSIRAFARDLGVHNTILSRFLTGKRALTKVTIEQIVKRVDSREWPNAEPPRKNTVQFKVLSLKDFLPFSAPHYFAILCLVSLARFKPDVKWIAKTLGLPEKVVLKAVNRLFRAGWLVRGPHGEWVNATPAMTVEDYDEKDYPRQYRARALKDRHRVHLRAFDENSPQYLKGASTISLMKKDLPEIQKRMEQFQLEIMGEFGKTENADDVYLMELLFSPVTIG